MRAVLCFKLPQDNDEYVLASHGADMFSVLWDLDQTLRNLLKYGGAKEYKNADAMAEYIRDRLYHLMHENGISFDMVS